MCVCVCVGVCVCLCVFFVCSTQTLTHAHTSKEQFLQTLEDSFSVGVVLVSHLNRYLGKMLRHFLSE